MKAELKLKLNSRHLTSLSGGQVVRLAALGLKMKGQIDPAHRPARPTATLLSCNER